MAEKKLAIVVPVKNRQAYLDVFLEAIPAYLEKVNGLHDFKIFVAEQVDEVPFNLSLSRNIGARFALDEDRFDYLIFHDVDLIPVENIDYGYREKNVCWFMKAGTCKIHKQALLDANGYNPSIWGWCSEDYEFYSRVCDFGHQMETWHQIPESRNAVIVDLDMNPQTRDECAAHVLQGRLGCLSEVPFADHEPEPLPVLHRADRLGAVLVVADADLWLLAHLDVGDQGADRRVPAGELDACGPADQAAPAVAPHEVLRPQRLAV